jgi:anaerobic ribonucleoside-triphosphate reductase activating protein
MTNSNSNIMLQLMDIVEGTSVDGVGLRTSVYFAGCSHHCKGCHNPESWDINNGKLYTIDAVMDIIKKNRHNVTLSGGDPFFQIDGALELCKQIKEQLGYTIWCYTGYRFEEVANCPEKSKILPYIDVLVDGRFELDKRDTSLLFRGSSNQRIIDVRASIGGGEPVVLDNFWQ